MGHIMEHRGPRSLGCDVFQGGASRCVPGIDAQRNIVVTGELYSLDGAKVTTPAMSQAGDIGADGAATVNLSANVTAPKLWNAEKPNLYYVLNST